MIPIILIFDRIWLYEIRINIIMLMSKKSRFLSNLSEILIFGIVTIIYVLCTFWHLLYTCFLDYPYFFSFGPSVILIFLGIRDVGRVHFVYHSLIYYVCICILYHYNIMYRKWRRRIVNILMQYITSVFTIWHLG